MAKKKKTPTGRLTHKPLGELHFDMKNPRFGGRAGGIKTEAATLDYIVENFGIEDVMGSIAANGYFESEPLVGVEGTGGITILEGNRRLAACLILAGDPRAIQQQKRIEHAKSLMAASGVEPPEEVPVLVVTAAEQKQQMLAYLGVRHICGLSTWDSYAKAVWIANVLVENKLTLAQIKRMIGDQHTTAPRILEGYYFVNQLIARDRFQPKQSWRKGRGSNPEYPFSWVYTSLGYNNVRAFVSLNGRDEPKENPVPDDHLDNAQQVMRFLFGDKEKEIKPVVPDSRQISELAICLESKKKVRQLEQGKTVLEVQRLHRRTADQLSDGLFAATESLNEVWRVIGERSVSPKEAEDVLPGAKEARRLAGKIHTELRGIVVDDGEASDDD